MEWIKELWANYCWHKWLIIYGSPTGLFVKIKCSKCETETYRGTY